MQRTMQIALRNGRTRPGRTSCRLCIAAMVAACSSASWTSAAPPEPVHPASTPAHAPGEVDLRPKFKVGDELKYVMTLENNGSTEMPPLEPSKQTSRQQIEFRLKTVSADPEKGSTVELIYDSMKLHLEAGDQKLDYDSKNPSKGSTPGSSSKPSVKGGQPSKKAPAQRGKQGQPGGGSPAPEDPAEIGLGDDPAELSAAALESALKPIVGAKMTLKVAPDGTITEVTGGQELAGALASKYAGPIADPQGVKDLLSSIFTTRSVKLFAKSGDTWQNVDRIDLSMLGKLRLTTNYTLKGTAGGRATIDFRGSMDLDTEGGLDAQPVKLTDTRYEGSYLWDTNSGTLETLSQTQAFTLGGDVGGTNVKIKSSGTTKIERQRH